MKGNTLNKIFIILPIFFILIGMDGLKEIKQIIGTKWILPVTEQAFDYIIFKDSIKFDHYSCEREIIYFGRYYISNDTIILKTDSAQYMHDFSKSTLKLLFSDNKLKPIYSKYGHLDAVTVFDSTFIYYRDTTFIYENK